MQLFGNNNNNSATKKKKKNKVVVLTGASGFLGGFLARQLQQDETVTKVYCPVREKKGVSGPERLKTLLGNLPKCCYLSSSADIPADATHVILNAYNTRFDEPLDKKLQENVTPILDILKQCRAHNRLQGICMVSTAYVQPPMPFLRNPDNHLDFCLNETKLTATQVYDKVLAGNAITELVPTIHEYYATNSYVFSKHMLEHLLAEQYADLPIAIVRPSMIAPAEDLSYGIATKSAIPLMMALGPHFILLAPNCAGLLNIVKIENVTADVFAATFDLAQPKRDKTHPVICATAKSYLNGMDLTRAAAPHVPRVYFKSAWMRNCLRAVEYFVVFVVFGSKVSKLLGVVYESYDFFMANTWDFDPRYQDDLLYQIRTKKDAYYKIQREKMRHMKGSISHTMQSRLLSTLAVVLIGYLVKISIVG